MKTLRETFVTHVMSNCLDANYQPLDPSNYDWKMADNMWEPVWYEGNPLPDQNEFEDDSENENHQDEAEDTGKTDCSGDEISDDSDYVASCDDSDSESEIEQ